MSDSVPRQPFRMADMQNVRKLTRAGFFIKFVYPKCVNYVNLKIATKQHIIQCTFTQAG